MADGRGASGRRSIGPHRAAARPRSRRQRHQGTRDRSHTARRGQMGETGDRSVKADHPRQSSAFSRRRDLCRAARRSGPIPVAPGAGNLRRHGGDGSAYRPRTGNGRRFLIRSEPVQPCHPGAAPAGLVVQAHRLCRGARQRLHAFDHRHGCADRNRHGGRGRHLEAGKLRRQILRPVHTPLRSRTIAQRDDCAAGARHRHAANRRICQALRRL